LAKFQEVLLYPDLDSKKRRDALKTLNEMVCHQETLDEMIDYEILEQSSNLLNDDDWEVREQAALLISAFAYSYRARERFQCAFINLRNLLEDPILKVREAVAYCFHRLSLNSHGCTLIIQSHSASSMINSFIKHSKDDKSMKKEEGNYLIHLLTAFVNMTFADEGIEPLLGVKATSTLNTIISQQFIEKIMSPEHK
jgi:hypothetical protein